MKIKTIEIANVKGIEHKVFSLDLIPNKPNFLVAPNGFGKSSFSVGFASLQHSKIALDNKYYFNNNDSNLPSISLEVEDGASTKTLIADNSKNTISSEFDVFVINSQLTAKATKLKIGGTVIAKPSLEIETTILASKIPEKVLFKYSLVSARRQFGANGKMLQNAATVFSNASLLNDIIKNVDFAKFRQVKISKALDTIKTEINAVNDTIDSLKRWILENKKTDFENIAEFIELANLMRRLDIVCDEVDSFLLAF